MNRRGFIAGAFMAAAPYPLVSAEKAVPTSSGATADGGRGILRLNSPEQVLPMLQNMRMRAIRTDRNFHPVPQQAQLTLLHFSDIHNDVANLRRVMEFYLHYRRFFDDALLTGDIAGGSWRDWSEEMMTVDGFRGVLKTIGNHDNLRWNGTRTDANARQCYDRYFDGIASWGVVQPDDSNPGLCYWYKAYPKCGIRLVGLDCMHYDRAQNTWFSAVLETAREEGLAVLAAQHYPPMNKRNTTGLPNCPFDSLQRESLNSELPQAVAAVDAFQKAGGEFICWLGGHTHADFCGTVNGRRQMFITVGIARNSEIWGDMRRVAGEKSQDLFNVVSVDVCRKHIRVMRVGAEWSRFMQRRCAMCLDYENRCQIA